MGESEMSCIRELQAIVTETRTNLTRLEEDNERMLKENYELSQRLKKLNRKLDEHIKTCGILTH
jgi:regulator of replication initiation timing